MNFIPENPVKDFINAIKYRFNLDEDKAAEVDVIDSIKKGVEFKGINLWTLIFAIFVASIGLNVNSTAVIIGAMLISPLMGPIMGIGLGAGIYDFELIKTAGKNLLIATFIGLIASFFYFFISPLQNAQSELLARTSPTIWDVLIAFFGGLAGIVASSRKKFNNVIPGVAIATALMPPLCTAGFGLATGQWSYFFGAFYLYLINSVFISISTFLIVRFLKFSPVSHVNPVVALKIKNWIGTIAILTILPSLYLAYYFVRNEMFIQNANRFLTEEAAVLNYSLLSKKIVPENRQIVITLINDSRVDSIKQFLELKKGSYNLSNAIISVSSNVAGDKKLDINQLKQGIIEDLFNKQENQLKASSVEIAILKNEISERTNFNIKREEAIKEFYSLYGAPKELVIDRTINFKELENDTILMVYLKQSKNNTDLSERENIKKWLSVKFGIEKVKLVID
jgi:uncharacterized hydrophobic protein (TIGR00271 family)